MTDTIAAEANPAADEHGTLEHLDPRSLVVDTNVRNVADVKADFIANIKEHGVLVPIVAVRDDHGQVLVRMGQRRTLAAREAGLTSVPVYVRALSNGDQLVERVTEQIVENDHRDDITEAQRARGIQQLLDAGVTVTRVAKRLSVNKDTVKAAQMAGKSSTAMQALDGGQLSLTEAAAITEFEDDANAVERLVKVAGTGDFDHTVAQVRAERESAQALAQAQATYAEQGYTLVDREQLTGYRLDCVPLRHLVTVDDSGEQVAATTEAVTNPQHWGLVLEEFVEYADVETGETVDEADIDWHTEHDPHSEPDEGYRHRNSVVARIVFDPAWYCLDPEAAGLSVTEHYQRNAEFYAKRREAAAEAESEAREHGDDEAADDGETEAEREAARLQAEAEAEAAERRKRKKVLTLNKLGDAAITVRREFVKTLVARKTLPKGAGTFVAECLARDAYMLTNHNADTITTELLGVEAGRQGLSKLAASSADARAQVITLALVLGALEARTPKEAWRNVRTVRITDEAPVYAWQMSVTSADYLQFLSSNGYTLSAVEEVITGARTADEVYDEYVAETAPQ